MATHRRTGAPTHNRTNSAQINQRAQVSQSTPGWLTTIDADTGIDPNRTLALYHNGTNTHLPTLPRSSWPTRTRNWGKNWVVRS